MSNTHPKSLSKSIDQSKLNNLNNLNLNNSILKNLKIQDEILKMNLENPTNLKRLNKYIDQKQIDFADASKQDEVKKEAMKYWNSGSTDQAWISNQNFFQRTIGHIQLMNFFLAWRSMHIINDNISLLELAAGVGRLTKEVFCQIPFIKNVDVLEPATKLKPILEKIKEENSKIGNIYITGAESLKFTKKYDVIFGEYVLENLGDLNLLQFLIRARDQLNENGKLIFAENLHFKSLVADSLRYHQRIRTLDVLTFFFKLAGLSVVHQSHANEHLWMKNFNDGYYFMIFVLKKEDI